MPILGRFIKLTIENNSFQKYVFSRNLTPDPAPNLKPNSPQFVQASAPKSEICPKNGAGHPRKTRVPPLLRRYFLLSALRSFVRWFSCQGAYVSRRRWRLPGAGALADVRGLRLNQSGAPSAIYRSRAQPGAPGRLNKSMQRAFARGAVARIAKAAAPSV